jgi:hypothetical protein
MQKATFFEADHSYILNDKKLISVTQAMKKHGLSSDYSFVDDQTLEAAAEYGNLVHAEIENFIKNGIIGITQELEDFVKLSSELGLIPEKMASEVVVNNDTLAGTIDLVTMNKDGESVLVDFKTTTAVNKEACRWQLSLYERLYGKKFDKLYIFHLAKKSRAIEVERIPEEEIDRFIECEKNGEIYQKKQLAVPDDFLQKVLAAETAIKEAEELKKKAETAAEAIRADLMRVMAEQGIKSFENEALKITYIEPSTREIIDQTRLKKELPEIAREYTKTTTTKESIRITVRK